VLDSVIVTLLLPTAAVLNNEKTVEESLITSADITYKIPMQDRVNVFIKDSPS
jgi:hypothetical protein